MLALSSIISPGNELAVDYTEASTESAEELPYRIIITKRIIDLLASPIPPVTTQTSTVAPTATARLERTSTPVPSPTPTLLPNITDTAVAPLADQPAPRSSIPSAVILGGIISVVLLVVAISLGVRVLKR